MVAQGLSGAHLRGRHGSARRWLLFGCLAIVVIVILGVAIVYVLATSTPPLPPALRQAQRQADTSRAAGPAAPATSAQAGQQPSAAQQVQALDRAEREGYTGAFQVTITQDDLNHELAQATAKGPVQDVTAAILQGQIVATGTAKLGRVPVKMFVRAEPKMANGRPRVVITQAYVGKFAASADLLAKLQGELDKDVASALSRSRGATIRAITARPGVLIIDGYLAGRKR